MASLFMEPELNAPPERVLNTDGEAFQTTCFDAPYDKHPHHHRLICGHVVITNKVVSCASNCEPSKKAESKPSGLPFGCPHLDCTARANVMVARRDRKTNRPIHPRKCDLSHVYGRDAGADEARLKEKEELALLGLAGTDISRAGRAAMTTRLRVLRRKRSKSPTARAQKPVTLPKKPAYIDSAATINDELEQDPARDTIMSFSGPGVRAKEGGRLRTKVDLASAGALRGLEELDVKFEEPEETRKPKASQRACNGDRKKSTNAVNPNFRDDNQEDDDWWIYNVYCDVCSRKIEDQYHKCFDCENFDVCKSCFEGGKYEHQTQHRFIAMDVPWNESSRFVKKFCKCQQAWTTHMVLCAECETPFHPSCDDHDHQTEQDMVTINEAACTADRAAWKGGQSFRCAACKETEASQAKTASATNDREIYKSGSRKRKVDDFEEETENATSGTAPSDRKIKRMRTAAQIKAEKPDIIIINDVEVDDDLKYLFDEDDMEWQSTVQLGSENQPTFTMQIPMR